MDNKEYHRQYYIKNKERLREQNKLWAERNKDKDRESKRISYHKKKNDPENIKHYLVKYAKTRANKKNIDFLITENDIILPEVCPILGIPFDRNTRRYSYSIDRIDPTKGYTKDNIWIISQIANAMKWDSTHEERLLFAKWVLSLEGGNQP